MTQGTKPSKASLTVVDVLAFVVVIMLLSVMVLYAWNVGVVGAGMSEESIGWWTATGLATGLAITKIVLHND